MFPPEVIDHVLSFLQWDHETLKICARAHPSLSKLVERHFYRHLTVWNFEVPSNYRDLLIVDNPNIPNHVFDHRDLLKRIVDNPNIPNHARGLRIHMSEYYNYQALESILPMLTQLRVISLVWTEPIFWDDLSESFRTAFTNCLRLPTLTHVRLSSIDRFPLSALDHSSSLKGLSLRGKFSYLSPASPLVRPPLDFLNLCGCSSKSIKIIASWVESRGLHSLRLSRSFERSSRLLEVCANTLTTLHVDVSSDYGRLLNAPSNDSTPAPLSLSCLPHLARLMVQTFIIPTRPPSFTSLPATMHLLDTLPSPPTNLVLLVIRVDITIDTYKTRGDISDTDWSSLISFPYFDVIPRVELRVCARKSWKQIPSVELLGELKQDPQLMQLEMHESFVINAVEEPDDDSSWFQCFGTD